MKQTVVVSFLILFVFSCVTFSQRRSSSSAIRSQELPSSSRRSAALTNEAIVIDDRLSVLREQPSLYATPMLRLRRGRQVQILGLREADGVTFYKTQISRNVVGWMQSEAVAGKFRRDDDERLARLVRASSGYEQIELAVIFLARFPSSHLRPAMLLYFGDLVEEQSLRLSIDATKRLVRSEMAASGAPLHSFYLNYSGLDRFRKLGLRFVFNANTKSIHYDGRSWRELIEKFPSASEVAEAKKRLQSLTEKIARK